jgi:uncharacterized protein (TIGR00251 family)
VTATAPQWLRPHPNGCTLSLRIQPGAKKNAILGLYSEGEHAALKVALQAPPIEGRANEALIAFLADLLRQSRSKIKLLSGTTSRGKVLLLSGMDIQQAQQALAHYLAGTA